MIGKVDNERRGLLLNVRYRKAGRFTNDQQQEVEYEEGDFCDFLPFGDTKRRIESVKIAPECSEHIYKATDKWYWGALVVLKLEDRQVIDVTLVADLFGDYMNYDI